MNNKAIIPISALVVAGTIALADVQGNGRLPGQRESLGFVVIYTMLSAGSDLGIPVANGFAVLVMITVLLTRGLEAFEYVTGKVGKPTKAKKQKAPRPSNTHSEPVKA